MRRILVKKRKKNVFSARGELNVSACSLMTLENHCARLIPVWKISHVNVARQFYLSAFGAFSAQKYRQHRFPPWYAKTRCYSVQTYMVILGNSLFWRFTSLCYVTRFSLTSLYRTISLCGHGPSNRNTSSNVGIHKADTGPIIVA